MRNVHDLNRSTDTTTGAGTVVPRRGFLERMAIGVPGLAVADTALGGDSINPSTAGVLESPLSVKQPHFTPRARHVIYLFMYGGPSQVDSWDYKPELNRRHGQKRAGRLRTRPMNAGGKTVLWLLEQSLWLMTIRNVGICHLQERPASWRSKIARAALQRLTSATSGKPLDFLIM